MKGGHDAPGNSRVPHRERNLSGTDDMKPGHRSSDPVARTESEKGSQSPNLTEQKRFLEHLLNYLSL